MTRLFLVALFFVVVACGSKPEKSVAIGEQKTMAANIEQGKVLFATCQSCHGAAGEGSDKLGGPALANSDPEYLYHQLKNFSQGIRGYLPQDSSGVKMAAFAKTLADTTAMWNVVKYIETLPAAAIANSGPLGDITKGRRTYETICGSCHGPGAKGNSMMHAPGLNGLQPWYLRSQIAKFKSSLRGAHPQDKYGAPMIPMMELLKDEQAVDDILAYIQSSIPDSGQ